MEIKIREPIMFNPQKHHLNFIKKQVAAWKIMNWEEVMDDLNRIGNNLLDLYYGPLSVKELITELHNWLIANGKLEKKAFLQWLGKYEYKKIRCSDGSDWLIKKGNKPGRFIHIHPAKNSVFTIRVRATTLKTVIMLTIQNTRFQPDLYENLKQVNNLRIKYLGLSPVKSLQTDKGIMRLWNFFNT